MDRLPEARWKAVLAALERWGLVLAQDAALPSVTTLAAGEVVRGSWWPHRENGAIYDAFQRLERAPVFSARLLEGKWTYVHERLVPAVHAMAAGDEAWQRAGLRPAAARLLSRVVSGEDVRTDTPEDTAARKALAGAATELERRLLAVSREVHTEGGHHARHVGPWVVPRGLRRPPADEARALLDAAAAALNAAHGARARLPWHARPGSSRAALRGRNQAATRSPPRRRPR